MSHILESLIRTVSVTAPTLLQKNHKFQGSQRRKTTLSDIMESQMTTETDSEKQLRLFVTMLMLRVLHKCNTLQMYTHEELLAHMKILVSQTMEGFTVTGNFSTRGKDIKKVCKAMLKDLQKLYGSLEQLQAVIVLMDADFNAIIVQSLQTHTRVLIEKHKCKQHLWGKEEWMGLLYLMGFIIGFLIIQLVLTLL